MKYSLNWLKKHCGSALPDITTIAREVTLRAFEIEEIAEKGGDTILEIKVLPDRAHDALSHRGMAREIGALLGVPRKERNYDEAKRTAGVPTVRVVIEDAKICPRYIATRIDNVTIGATPKEMAAKIEAVGGKSISNIVDITNFVLFDIGQPLHAFDAEKVAGGITVRLARAGEMMTTLDNRALTLHGSELVIADDEGVLALAGIKGGKKAEVTTATKSIILECANFDSTITRKTSQKHNIKTDASKRYENGMTSAFAKEGCDIALSLLALYGGEGVAAGQTTDIYPSPEEPSFVSISTGDVNRLLGLTLSADDLSKVLTRAGHTYEKKRDVFTITAPEERLDLRIKEEMIEEVGRHVGYEAIVPILPTLPRKGVPHKRMHYANIVRKLLVERGFSEVFTYSFARPGEGEIEVLHPVGNDRPFMRRTLATGLWRSLVVNFLNAPLIGIDNVHIFEFGNVFPVEGEKMSLALGVRTSGKKKIIAAKEELRALVPLLGNAIGAAMVSVSEIDEADGLVIEIDFDASIKDLPEPGTYNVLRGVEKEMRYKTLSAYPFIVRDIAIFVPQEVTEEYIETLLKKEAGELVVRFAQFDKFQKPDENRISYGYRMVFQSFERTLTDDEVGAIMERVTLACNKEAGWQVR